MAENKIRIVIAADGSAAITGIKGVSGSLGEMERGSAGIVGRMKSHWLGISAAVVSAYLVISKSFSFIQESIELANAQEEAEKRLTVALGYRSQALLDQAAAIQSKTTYEDDAVVSAQAMLAMFVKDEAQIKKATEATLDLAAAKGMDLKNAADLVSKTLGSSTNALSRYGIEVTGAVGSTERLESTVNNISRVFGGQAAVAADTYGGKVVMLKNAWGDMKEEVGAVFTQNRFMIETTGILKTAVEDLTKWVKEHRAALMEMVRSAVLFAVEAFQLLIETLDKAAAAWRYVKASSTAFAESQLAMQGDLSAASQEVTRSILDENKKREESWQRLRDRIKKLADDIRAAQTGAVAPAIGGAPGVPGAGGEAKIPDWMKALQKAAFEEALAYDKALIEANEAWRKWDIDQIRQGIVLQRAWQKELSKIESERQLQARQAAENIFESITDYAGGKEIVGGVAGMFGLEEGTDPFSQMLDQRRAYWEQVIELERQGKATLQAVEFAHQQYVVALDAQTNASRLQAAAMYLQVTQGIITAVASFSAGQSMAMFLVSRAVAVAMAIVQGHLAAIGAAAALAPIPITGPALAAAAYSKWMAITYANAGIMAAIAVGQASQMGRGTAVGGGYAYPGGVQPVPVKEQEPSRVSSPIINVHVYGPYVGDEARFARDITPALRKAWEDNV